MAEVEINGVTYKISCTMADCDKNLHNFRTNSRLQKQGVEKGCCRYCKSSLINWERIYKKDINDYEYTKNAFKLEMVRHVFWSIKTPTPEMLQKITSLNVDVLEDKVQRRLLATLNKTHSQNLFDGRQTPIDDDLVHWAQHATGTCCRTCLEEWHGIGAENPISPADYQYLQKIVMKYLEYKSK